LFHPPADGNMPIASKHLQPGVLNIVAHANQKALSLITSNKAATSQSCIFLMPFHLVFHGFIATA
jgi:hypothetical protein